MEKCSAKELLNSLLIEYKVQKKLKDELNKQFGREFNIFEILSFTKNNYISNLPENQISNIIAELLKPLGIHGQGTIFLKLFLEEIFQRIEIQIKTLGDEKDGIILQDLEKEFLNSSKIESSKIEREYTTDKGKFIDILICLPKFYKDGDLIIAIENKPWAKEQEDTEKDYRQIEHYVKFLEKLKNASKIRDFVFIYLSEDREAYSIDKNEKEELKEQGRFLELSYTDFLIFWLTLCKKYCNAEKVKLIIDDFINWILKKFKDEGGDRMCKEVLKSWLLEFGDSQEKAELFYKIYKNFPEIVEERFKELFERVKERLERDLYKQDIQYIIENGNDTISLWIYNKNWKKYEDYLKNLRIVNYALQIEWDINTGSCTWYVGLCRPENKGSLNYENYKNLELKTRLEKLIEKIKEKNPEYKYQDDEWWQRDWWIIRNEIRDSELMFKIFTEVRAKEIEEKWYKEIKTFIDITIDELNDSLKGV